MTKERLERTAGVILLGFAVLLIIGAALALVQAITRRAEEGGAELVALGQFAAVVFGAAGFVILVAAIGVLRGRTWGKRLGLILTGLFGVLGVWDVFSSPMPWDHSANLGIYETGPLEWFLGLVPVVASWIAFAALVLARNAPIGAQIGDPQR